MSFLRFRKTFHQSGRCFRLILLTLFASMAFFVLMFGATLQRSSAQPSRPTKPIVIADRISTNACRIPEFSPFDFTVVRFFERQDDPVCPGRPSFLRLTAENVLEIDETILREHYNCEPSTIKCFHREITRAEDSNEPDSHNMYGPLEPLELGEEISIEFLEITCNSQETPILQQLMMVPILKDKVEQRVQTILDKRNFPPERTNVLVLGVDSVSYLNAYRHLRQTLAYLKTQMRPVELRGYVKVGDNSFPNQNPLIDGLTEGEASSFAENGFFDRLTDQMIWSEYTDVGYRSLFLEESARFGLYHYHLKGFRRPPTDYYTRPFIMEMEKSPLRQNYNDDIFCHTSRMTSDLYLDYVYRFATLMTAKSANYFAYVWLSDVPHNKMNSVGSMDKILANHLESLNENGLLNNTMLVFLSDHGMRFDKIRTTTVGKYEDRMPFAFVSMPIRFCERHPRECAELERNANRLTTHFDLHATFRDLLHLEGSIERARSVRTTHGQSLFAPVAETRTCSQASIEPMWCTCDADRRTTNLSVELFPRTVLATRVGSALESKLNAIVDRSPCYQFRLKQVLEVQEVQAPDGAQSTSRYFWVTAEFSPGSSVFEATVTVFRNGTTSVGKDISRCNMYWGTSWCMADHWMEKFCHCKSFYTSLYFWLTGA